MNKKKKKIYKGRKKQQQINKTKYTQKINDNLIKNTYTNK